VLEKPFTYVVEGAEEEPITLRRSDVQLAVMEEQQLLKVIHGELGTFIEKDYDKNTHLLSLKLIVSPVNLYEY